MAHVFFSFLHIFMFLFGFIGLIVSIPLHIIYSTMSNSSKTRSINEQKMIAEQMKQTQILKQQKSQKVATKKDDKNMDAISDEIRKLAKLKEEGLITEDEYNKKKADILGNE